MAGTVCQILNLSWLDFSQATTFHKTNQICIFNNVNPSITHITTNFEGLFASDVLRIETDFTFEFHAIVELYYVKL